MATHATSSDVTTLKALYSALISNMTHSSATALAIYQQQATNALNLWADAYLALQNLNASAASSYSNGVGMSVTKRRTEAARTAVDQAMDEFRRQLELGGVTLPTGDSGVAFWDFSTDQYQ